jgi:5-methylcytosine-specific restriction endonuclease McrA
VGTNSAEYYREYRKRNAERRREIERQYRERNADKVVAKNARWRKAAAAHRAEYNRQWAASHRAEAVARTMRHRAKNPRQHVEAVKRYTLRKRCATVVAFTPDQLALRLSMFDGCWMCGNPADTVDHVKPLAKGGAHMLCNLRPACRSCNSSKNDRWPFVPSARPTPAVLNGVH